MQLEKLQLFFHENSISIFYEGPPSHDKALNSTIQEKVRRFNNSVLSLYDAVNSFEKVYTFCDNTSNNPYDNLARRYLRQVYLELFIYREKIVNIVMSLFFLKSGESIKNNMKMIKKRAEFFPELTKFCTCCDDFAIDEKCKMVMQIRSDEVHNLSQIDSFNLEFDEAVKVVNKGYKLKISDLKDGYEYVIKKLTDIKECVQELIDTKKMWGRFYKLKKLNETICVT